MSEHKSLAAALAAFQSDDVATRFLSYVTETPSGCWQWNGGTSRHGYGVFHVSGRANVAHRWAFANIAGHELIPKMVIDHLCRNKGCVNPTHLEQVTQSINIQRGDNVNRSKTHCSEGHPFTPENTRVRPRGGRTCLTCQRAYDRARYLAKKEAKTHA